MSIVCGLSGCQKTFSHRSTLSMHRAKVHATERVSCRDPCCTKEFLSPERERAHYYKEHMDLRCGVESCAKKTHEYSHWKKLKMHLDSAHKNLPQDARAEPVIR